MLVGVSEGNKTDKECAEYVAEVRIEKGAKTRPHWEGYTGSAKGVEVAAVRLRETASIKALRWWCTVCSWMCKMWLDWSEMGKVVWNEVPCVSGEGPGSFLCVCKGFSFPLIVKVKAFGGFEQGSDQVGCWGENGSQMFL